MDIRMLCCCEVALAHSAALSGKAPQILWQTCNHDHAKTKRTMQPFATGLQREVVDDQSCEADVFNLGGDVVLAKSSAGRSRRTEPICGAPSRCVSCGRWKPASGTSARAAPAEDLAKPVLDVKLAKQPHLILSHRANQQHVHHATVLACSPQHPLILRAIGACLTAAQARARPQPPHRPRHARNSCRHKAMVRDPVFTLVRSDSTAFGCLPGSNLGGTALIMREDTKLVAAVVCSGSLVKPGRAGPSALDVVMEQWILPGGVEAFHAEHTVQVGIVPARESVPGRESEALKVARASFRVPETPRQS
eukprot:s4787_g5.t1